MALTAGPPQEQVQAPRQRGAGAAHVRVAAVLVVVLALLGVPVGLLWSALAPRPDVVPVQGGLEYVDTESKDFFGGDGTLLVLLAVAGLLTAVGCWLLARRRPLGAVVGLVLGSCAGSVVAWRTGLVGESRTALLAAARAGRITGPTDLPLQLRARTVLLAWPAVAALTCTVLSLRGGLEDSRSAPAPDAAVPPPAPDGSAPPPAPEGSVPPLAPDAPVPPPRRDGSGR